MSERHESRDKRQSLILVHSLFLEKLIQLSNPQPQLDFHYALRILTSNLQFLPRKKRLRHPTLGPLVNISL